MYRYLRQTSMMAMLSLLSLLVISCGGGGGGDGSSVSVSGSNDFVKLTINGGAETTYTEAFSATIVCDPRVDWAFSQVILYDNYLGSNQWDKIFDIMFGVTDIVGTYDIALPTDGLQVVYLDGTVPYIANFAEAASSGTVTVTRSDTRIEGTFSITAVDASINPITLSGSFGVDAGVSLSCL